MRLTLDLEPELVLKIESLAKQEGRSVDDLVSRILADAFSSRIPDRAPGEFVWISRSLEPRVDLEDRDAVLDAADSPHGDRD